MPGSVIQSGMMGAFLGWKVVLLAIYVGILMGGLVGVLLLLLRLKRFRQYMAFGPFLALGGVVAVLWGHPVLGWYFG